MISAYISSSIVDPVFGSPHTHSNRGDPLRDLRVRDPDICRLQRVHRHRHRDRPAARLPLPPELRRSVHGPVPPGFLAEVAHDAVEVASRLPLHTSRREQGLRGAHCAQHHDHDDPGRSLARCGLDLRGLGRLPRRRSGRRKIQAATAGVERGRAGPDTGAGSSQNAWRPSIWSALDGYFSERPA